MDQAKQKGRLITGQHIPLPPPPTESAMTTNDTIMSEMVRDFGIDETAIEPGSTHAEEVENWSDPEEKSSLPEDDETTTNDLLPANDQELMKKLDQAIAAAPEGEATEEFQKAKKAIEEQTDE